MAGFGRRTGNANPGFKAMLAKGRLKTGDMNKLEAEYAQLLDAELLAGRVAWWRFEAMRLRLADNTFYNVDFSVMLKDGTLECHEVKGGLWRDDARVKIKVAAAQYPMRFIAVQRALKRDGGGWKVEAF